MTPAACDRADGSDWRAQDLVVVRESGPDPEQLLGMAQQAHATASQVEGIDALKKIGTRPLYEPERYDAELWTSPSCRLALMPAPGTEQRTWQVLATASASRTGASGQWWSDVLATILRDLRPHRLWLPSASRLTRDALAGHQLLRVIEDTVDEVRLGGSPIPVGPQNPYGMQSLGFAISFAASERDELVRRNIQGKLTAASRQRFLPGPAGVPLGYRLGHDGVLAVDPAAGPVLELAARLLADPGATAEQVRDAMSRAGLRTPALSGSGGWEWDADAVDAELAALRPPAA